MIKFLYILLSCVVIDGLSAPSSNSTYRSALLENRVWKVQLPHNKQCVMEMESRNYGRRSVLSYDRKRTDPFYSYSLCKDTVKVSESGKKLVIRDLTDSTLALQCLPDTLTVWVCPVRCVTDNSLQEHVRMKTAWTALGGRIAVGTLALWIFLENQSKTCLPLSSPDGRSGITTWKSISLPKWYIPSTC